MKKSRTNIPDEPAVSLVQCDGCGEIYEELTLLVWARQNALIGLLYCIECDEGSSSIRFVDAYEVPDLGQ